MIQHALLDEPIISIIERGTQARWGKTLPGVLAALVRDEIDDFPALRPHQRHVWHAFLVQIAAIYLHRSGTTVLPQHDAEWRSALLSLTPDDPDGAAWALVSPINRPALLQPPVPEGTLKGFSKVYRMCDELDMLVTAKNHDVKREAIRSSRAEHWFFALLSLQTQEGYMGSGNYGISRMNSGRGSRPSVGVAPSGGPGRRFVRDALRMNQLRPRILEDFPMYPSDRGISLLWLSAWNGSSSLPLQVLDPFYVEVCRRIRLRLDSNGRIVGVGAGTKSARVDAKVLRGQTGDGWAPLVADDKGRKSLTVQPPSFGYEKLVPILLPRTSDPDSTRRAPLQIVTSDDDERDLAIAIAGVVRGEGETQGYHERRIPISVRLRRSFVESPSDEGAAVAEARVKDAGTMARKVLYPAALGVFTAAPLEGERKRDDDTAKARAGRVLDLFDQHVDQTFFEALSLELEVLHDDPASRSVRATWLEALMDHARDLLDQCAAAAPSAAMRSYRTRARVRDQLEYAFRRQFGEIIASAKPVAGVSDADDASVNSAPTR